MIDFIFDNIAIIGFVLYALIVFVSKIFTIDDSQVDAPQRSPVKTRPQNKPVSSPQRNESYNFPEKQSPLFDITKNEQIEDFDDEKVENNYNVDAPRKLMEQMTEHSHFFHDGNSYTPDESFLQDDDDNNDDVILSEKPKNDNQTSQNEFDDILKDNNALRKAFVASEILGKPKSMR